MVTHRILAVWQRPSLVGTRDRAAINLTHPVDNWMVPLDCGDRKRTGIAGARQARDKPQEELWRYVWATPPPTSRRTPPRARSTSTSASATRWGILFSHPKDFTPVCTTELGAFSKAKGEFDKRNTKLLGLSVDSVESHNGWKGDIEETQGQALNFPLDRRPGPQGCRPLRHDPPERQRHAHGALGLHHRPGQEGRS